MRHRLIALLGDQQVKFYAVPAVFAVVKFFSFTPAVISAWQEQSL